MLVKDRLLEIQKRYPELTFNNDGYEYLSQDTIARHSEIIAEIKNLLKQCFGGVSSFSNFCNHNGKLRIRFQASYEESSTGFIGVVYEYIDSKVFNKEVTKI